MYAIRSYYVVPEETQSEIYSPGLAYFQLVALLVTGVVALIGFFFGWTQGRPLLEIPRPLDFVVVVGALIVITSYSIHYTKLYEHGLLPCRNPRRGRGRRAPLPGP